MKDYGNALQFTAASGQYVDVTSHASLQIAGALTLMAWINVSDRSDYYAIISKFTDDTHCEFVLRLQTTTGKLHVQFGKDGTTTDVAESTNAVPIGTWTHIAMVHESDNSVTFYINGQVDSNHLAKSFGSATTANMNIGRRTGGFAPFNGSMDDVRVYNAALRGTEIQEIMQYPGIGPKSESLVSWYKFDTGSGVTATDSKGSNNGDLTGHAPSWVTSGVPSGRTKLNTSMTRGVCKFGMTYNDNIVDPPASTELGKIKNLGFDRVRLLFCDYTWSEGITRWRGVAQTSLGLGLYTVYGISAITTGITSGNWTTFANAVKTEAQWCQDQNNALLEFQIGNEEALHHDGSISDATLISNLKTLATEVQAIYTVGKVSYTDWIGVAQNWMDAGIGDDLDYIGMNIYNESIGSNSFSSILDWVYGTWRNRVFISEFSPDSRGLTAEGLWGTDADRYAQVFKKDMEEIAAKPFFSAYMYTWRYADDKFGLVTESTGTPQTWYYPLLGQRRVR